MRLTLITLLLASALGCDEENACDDWAAYVCACHSGDPEFDCDELISLADAASTEIVDQCAVDLAAQQADDTEAGLECDLL